MCVAYLLLKEASALCGFIVAIPFLISNYQRKYIIKENGDLWVKTVFGVSQKAIGVNCILYNPSAKGWQWRVRQMVVRYQNGLKKGTFFPVLLLADPETGRDSRPLKSKKKSWFLSCNIPINK